MSRRAMGAPTGAGRLRTAWRAAHRPVAGVPARTRRLAYAVPLVVLPSGVWRLPAAFDSGLSDPHASPDPRAGSDVEHYVHAVPTAAPAPTRGPVPTSAPAPRT
ncbi:hypothetical protein ACFV2Q_16095 [Streptomyces sp. NPDC059650]|uniref:hypothetical protein n=1 Tax=Streptomyces sp. NPDC059650 TaxID=3346896 RepID=UPI0036AE6C8E